jgi:hypothetical protein
VSNDKSSGTTVAAYANRPLLLTQRDAAIYIGIGIKALRGLIDAGQLAIVQRGGDKRVPAIECERWVRESMRPCPSTGSQTKPDPGKSRSGSKASVAARRSRPTPSDPSFEPWNERSKPKPGA